MEIRRRHANGETQTAIAKDFPISQPAISQIIRGRCYKLSPDEKKQKKQQTNINRLIRRRAREKGLNVEDVRIAIFQKNACEICGKTKTGRWGTLHLDHRHGTEKVRGVLCINCNQGLGNFHDSPDLLQKAIDYLRRT